MPIHVQQLRSSSSKSLDQQKIFNLTPLPLRILVSGLSLYSQTENINSVVEICQMHCCQERSDVQSKLDPAATATPDACCLQVPQLPDLS